MKKDHKKHHKKTKHRRRQKHNNSKRTRKNRAGTTGMIHTEHYDPLIEPSIRESKLISPDRVIPRTLPNSQILGGISIINMKTNKRINTFIRQNQKLIEVKKKLSVQPEIDCTPE